MWKKLKPKVKKYTHNMMEKITKLPDKEAYNELRDILLREKCKIIDDDPPKRIVVEQGSLWGYSPKTYKKIISFHFIPYDSGTRVVSDISWTSDNIALTILGLIVCVIFAGLFWWLKAEVSRIWWWSSTLINTLNLFVFIFIGLAVFGVFFDVYCYAKREIVAEKLLRLLP